METQSGIIRTDRQIQLPSTATHGRVDVYEKGLVLIKIAESSRNLPMEKAIATCAMRNKREQANKRPLNHFFPDVHRVHYVMEVYK